jgi:hypothetical protein
MEGKESSMPIEGNPAAASAGAGLRARVLATPPEKLGFVADSEFPDLYGVLVDWPIGDAVASILALRDGSASLYTTSTFGIIGGGENASVRAAAQSCVHVAADCLAHSQTITGFPLPANDDVYFYLLTYAGVRRCVGDLDALSTGADLSAPLFDAAQEVLTQLRMTMEDRLT